jgi:prepilin-type N-terminal cleavage/methylation domain-containing protein
MEELREKGNSFTLIELLIVIFIIGLLASISTGYVMTARNRAKDARTVSDMAQIRIEAEKYYSEQMPNSYLSFACTNPGNMTILCADINKQVGSEPTINTTDDAFCAELNLLAPSGPESWYCVDSTGRAKFYPDDPACSSTTFTCE